MTTKRGSGLGGRDAEKVIGLNDIYLMMCRNKWKIIGLPLAFSVIAAFVAVRMKEVYLASTTVLIETNRPRILSIDDVYSGDAGGKEYLLTQFAILGSRELAERVVVKMDLRTHPLFDPRQQDEKFNFRKLINSDYRAEPLSEEKVNSDVLKAFQERLTIAPVRNTQLVKINFQSTDPQLAAKITEAMVEEYIQSTLDAKLSVTVQAADRLTDRLTGLRETLKESERELQEYRESAGLLDMRGVQTLDADELMQLTQRHIEASRTRSEAESALRQVQQFGLDPSSEQLMSIPEVMSDPLVQRMKEEHSQAERRVAELSNRYGPKHPKMIATRSDAQQTKANLEFQVRRAASSINSRYASALHTEKSIKSQLDAAKRSFQDVNRKEFRLQELEREVAANRELYDMFLTRAKETTEAEGMQTAHARVVDPAVVPQKPFKPNKRLIVGAAAFLGLVAGAIITLVTELMTKVFRTPDDVEEKLNVPLIGFLPLVTSNKSKLPMEGFGAKSKGVFAEAIRSVRTAFVLSGLDKNQKVAIVTSSIPGEGKSTVALNLTRALSQVEKVLLIDADMRRPTLSRVLDLPKGSPGLSNLVVGSATAAETIYKMDDWDVDVLPSGKIPHNPLELISSKRFKSILEKLSAHYDRIIIDTAPVCAVSDALMLSTFADALIYVVKADSTSIDLVKKGLSSLQEVEAPLVGVVLNQIDVKKVAKYGDYYSEYFQNYGYSSEEEFYAQQKYQKSKGDEVPYEQRRVSGVDDI